MIKNHKGDTIVEVMIAIIVLGAALGGAFAISNASQKRAQANYERYQGQLYVNQQAELLKSQYNSIIQDQGIAARDTFKSNATYQLGCFDSSGDWVTSVPCIIDGRYNMTVTRVTTAGGVNPITYTIVAEWDAIGDDANGGRDKVELLYGL